MVPAGEVVDPAGRPWLLPDLIETMLIVSIFTMVMAEGLAFIRAFDGI